MPQPGRLSDTHVMNAARTAVALALISEMDFLRLKSIARLYARGLPSHVGWDDLLQEAITRVLVGKRRIPEGVPAAAFIAGVIRSVRSEHWRRTRREAAYSAALEWDGDTAGQTALVDPAPDAERMLAARQALDAIGRLFADDALALQIIAGLGEGHAPEQICSALAISRTDYDSARKRMRRKLLREGIRIRCEAE